ncbi:hypothetical protein FGG08_004868 [Glutinoglossum americanum]|uniref:S-adenosyl-L-methionine-dependent methyltransferase n=1 Tax=Glutinoglossum americanum TaxID=1670608 RepID=A0A9P8I4R5_9PEZI|nr:hypothetical protein FGG08_004868 [Glutinoglossum americanum]
MRRRTNVPNSRRRRESTTTSLASEITKYEFENGRCEGPKTLTCSTSADEKVCRRYHSYRSGQYAFPNDENELDRMDLENHLFSLVLGGNLHLAPLDSPQRILDLGTGTGIWAIDMADRYPSAAVIGTELSPVQPKWVPPNLTFQIDDFSQDWTFQEDSFDLIHWRLLLASISDYPRLFKQAFDHTKPGGYLEVHEIDPMFYCDDGSLPEGSSARQWSVLFLEACAKLGRAIPPTDSYKVGMEAAGFVDVQERVYKRPSNTWPKDPRLKEIGKFTYANHVEGLHAFTIGPFTRALGWTPLEVEVLLAKARAEWRSRAIHGYQKGGGLGAEAGGENAGSEGQEDMMSRFNAVWLKFGFGGFGCCLHEVLHEVLHEA